MVTTTAAIIQDPVKRRPASYNIFLWCIPLLSWTLLIAVFFTSAQQDSMVKLLATDNTTLIKNVQNYLETENIPFILKDNVILVNSSDKPRVLRAAARQKWFDPNAGWDQSLATPPQSAPSSLSNLAREGQVGEGS